MNHPMALKADLTQKLESELEKGASHAKCRQCGCMVGALEEMKAGLLSIDNKESAGTLKKVDSWLGKMEASLYT